jgi:hypothetical protein
MGTRMSLEIKIGRLMRMASGYWGIVYEDGLYDEIHSGDTFDLEIPGSRAMAQTRIEYHHGQRRFYSVDGFILKEGARASFRGMRF